VVGPKNLLPMNAVLNEYDWILWEFSSIGHSTASTRYSRITLAQTTDSRGHEGAEQAAGSLCQGESTATAGIGGRQRLAGYSVGKASFFPRLGFCEQQWEVLADALKSQARENKAT
jgi:hypothetical protein